MESEGRGCKRKIPKSPYYGLEFLSVELWKSRSLVDKGQSRGSSPS